MANKEKKKVPFKRECFEAALKLRGMSIRRLGAVDSGLGWSEKTIRRGLEDGQISPDLLDVLAKLLDVDPDYLSGKYHARVEKYADPYLRAYALRRLKPEKYPYLLKKQRDKIDNHALYERYLENIFLIHNISIQQFELLPFSVKKELQLKIEKAICPVLIQYFEKDAFGNDTDPEIWSLESSIFDYNPDFTEPPEQFFKDMMEDDDYISFAAKDRTEGKDQ